ncbi:MAG: M48 family metalloprotease, partial [Planctomycetota bacterium]
MPGNTFVTPLTLGIAYVVVFVVCLLAGRAQGREGRASFRRLLKVAALMALLVLMPAVPPLLFGEKLDMSWAGARRYLSPEELREMGGVLPAGAEPAEEDPGYWIPDHDDREVFLGSGHSGWFLPMNLLVMLCGLGFTLRLGIQAMRPVQRLLREHVDLPEVTDPKVLASVQGIAERMHAARPRILRLGSMSGSLAVHALTGGMVAPVLIATDGLLERLDDDDTTALLAHEMSHIVRRSVWCTMLMVVLVMVVMVVASALLFASVTLALGYALMWVVVKVHGQFDEPACDLAAARAVGFGAMTRALGKIHAANSLPCGPLVRRLFHATQTHPSEAVRREHLARHAPAAEQSSLLPDTREAALQHRTNRVVLGLLVLVLAFGVWAGLDEDLKWYGVAALLLTVLTPFTLMLLAALRRLNYAWRVGLVRLPWAKVDWFLFLVVVFATAIWGLFRPWAWPTWAALAVLVFEIGRRRLRTRINSRVRHGTRTQDFQLVLGLHELLPRRVRQKREQ